MLSSFALGIFLKLFDIRTWNCFEEMRNEKVFRRNNFKSNKVNALFWHFSQEPPHKLKSITVGERGQSVEFKLVNQHEDIQCSGNPRSLQVTYPPSSVSYYEISVIYCFNGAKEMAKKLCENCFRMTLTSIFVFSAFSSSLFSPPLCSQYTLQIQR